MDAAFDGVSDDTFENVLGGVHALVVEEGELIGHGSVIQRRLLHAGRALRTGYVEGVAVREDRQRRGHGAAMMSALERVVRTAGPYPPGRRSPAAPAAACGRAEARFELGRNKGPAPCVLLDQGRRQ
jgi:GNAT superfamily N-acetyltransferase